MEEGPTLHGSARRDEDIALDLMKFVAMTTGYGANHVVWRGVSGHGLGVEARRIRGAVARAIWKVQGSGGGEEVAGVCCRSCDGCDRGSQVAVGSLFESRQEKTAARSRGLSSASISSDGLSSLRSSSLQSSSALFSRVSLVRAFSRLFSLPGFGGAFFLAGGAFLAGAGAFFGAAGFFGPPPPPAGAGGLGAGGGGVAGVAGSLISDSGTPASSSSSSSSSKSSSSDSL